MNRLSTLLLALLLVAFLPAGCSSPSSSSPAAPEAIREINLLVMPTALTLDGQPGADAVAVKIFAATAAHAQTAPLRNGVLEVIAFDGTLDPALPTDPFHTWRFTPADLARRESKSVLGTGYDLTLSWSPKVLRTGRLTLVARFLPPQGRPVLSAPSFVVAATL